MTMNFAKISYGRFICSPVCGMLRTEKGRKKGTESTQRDKPLDGSRGEAPSSNERSHRRGIFTGKFNVTLECVSGGQSE